MTTLPLPRKSVLLSPEGVEAVYELMRADLETARIVADEFASRPKPSLEYLFEMTDAQTTVLETLSDDALLCIFKAMLVELRSENPGPIAVRHRRKDDPLPCPEPLGGSCKLHIRPGPPNHTPNHPHRP